MKNVNLKWILGAALLSGLTANAGSISIGTSPSVLTFTSPNISLGACTAGTCTISGAGTLSGAPLQWSILTTLSGNNSITDSGAGPTFSISENGANIVFSLIDTPLADVLIGTLVLSSALNSSSPDLTDLTGTITFTTTNLTNPALKAYLLTNLGAIPTVGSTAILDLTISCGSTTACIQANDPTGSVVSATILPNNSLPNNSSTPEPGTEALLGGGLAVLFWLGRARRNRA